ADPLVFDGLTRREGVVPAPYLARHHWVKVETSDLLPFDVARGLLTDAHLLVASKLPKKTRTALGIELGAGD
ncbi:MAG: hypothetical protein MI919_40695, partial [Holophagales bacterium]|nr:hypothetical protein [Holophagales bacterium]